MASSYTALRKCILQPIYPPRMCNVSVLTGFLELYTKEFKLHESGFLLESLEDELSRSQQSWHFLNKIFYTFLIDQYILGFHISMENFSTVTIRQAIQNLFHNTFDLRFRQFLFLRLQIFLQVVIKIIENNLQVFLFWLVLNLKKSILLKVYGTMFGWSFRVLSREIYLNAVEGIPSSSL